MKSFAFVLVVVQAVLIQNAYSQCLRPAVVAQPNVAASLADTLSLLTVSSLLSETLPLNPNVVATVPVGVTCGGCGGGCGCGYGGCGYGGCGYGGCGGYGYGSCGCGGLGYGYFI